MLKLRKEERHRAVDQLPVLQVEADVLETNQQTDKTKILLKLSIIMFYQLIISSLITTRISWSVQVQEQYLAQ